MDAEYMKVLLSMVARSKEAMEILDQVQIADDDLGDIYLGDEIRRAAS